MMPTQSPAKRRKWPWLLLPVGLVIIAALASIAFGSARLSPPPITEGIACNNWRNCGKEDQAFNAVLSRRFPLGSKASNLRAALIAQGFFDPLPSAIKTCSPAGESGQVGQEMIECPAWDENWNPHNFLEHSSGIGPCGRNVIVQWSSDKNGKITHIEGAFDNVCI
jgi:hypothetical protein